MKRSKLKKKSKMPIALLQRKIWAVVRELVFQKYGRNCYTCDAKSLSGANLQCGHMYAKASLGAYLKYDLRVLRAQCFRCNIHHGGMGAVFYERMLKEIGEANMMALQKDRQVLVKAQDHYEKIYIEYGEEYKRLSEVIVIGN